MTDHPTPPWQAPPAWQPAPPSQPAPPWQPAPSWQPALTPSPPRPPSRERLRDGLMIGLVLVLLAMCGGLALTAWSLVGPEGEPKALAASSAPAAGRSAPTGTPVTRLELEFRPRPGDAPGRFTGSAD